MNRSESLKKYKYSNKKQIKSLSKLISSTNLNKANKKINNKKIFYHKFKKTYQSINRIK